MVYRTGHAAPQPDSNVFSALSGQSIIHTRVERRGTWTVTARGWSIWSRQQRISGDYVSLRDPRLLGAVIATVGTANKADLLVNVNTPQAPAELLVTAPWKISGPLGVELSGDVKGNMRQEGPTGPRFVHPGIIEEYRSTPISGVERQILRAAMHDNAIHPGHVVTVLVNSGALEDSEFEARGPMLLGRLLSRGELQAGFVHHGVFTPWQMPLEDVIEHIGATWAAIGGREPGPDMIAWFALTDKGRESLGPTGADARGPGMSGYDSPGVVGGGRRHHR